MISVYGNYTYNDAATCAAAGVSFKTQPKNTVSEKVTLSPNPCSAFVKINLPETNQEAVYRLFDILGKEYTVNFIASTVNSKIIDTHNLENGTYLIKIQGDKNEETLKLVILK
jgi:hypothetical protein